MPLEWLAFFPGEIDADGAVVSFIPTVLITKNGYRSNVRAVTAASNL